MQLVVVLSKDNKNFTSRVFEKDSLKGFCSELQQKIPENIICYVIDFEQKLMYDRYCKTSSDMLTNKDLLKATLNYLSIRNVLKIVYHKSNPHWREKILFNGIVPKNR